MFGNIIGRSTYAAVGATQHFLNLYAVFIGETSKSRKGTGKDEALRLFRQADEVWVENNTPSGLSSGEGLITRVRDSAGADDGVPDKRLLVIESEFASVLTVAKREGNTLISVLRDAWDGKPILQNLVKKDRMKATGAHLSFIGHITREELLRHLTETESANGFANRFLWFCNKRSKCLPDGGCLTDQQIQKIAGKLTKTVRFIEENNDMKVSRTEAARKLWHEVYPELSEGKPGLLGAMTARAEAQVLRLSCIYALMDQKKEVDVPHLKAALALWDYSERSCQYIFGETLGDPVADRVLTALRNSPQGLSRTIINSLFSGNKESAQIDRALGSLLEKGLAFMTPKETGGRPSEIWFARTVVGIKKKKKINIKSTQQKPFDVKGRIKRIKRKKEIRELKALSKVAKTPKKKNRMNGWNKLPQRITDLL
jgi:hypothetical protein